MQKKISVKKRKNFGVKNWCKIFGAKKISVKKSKNFGVKKQNFWCKKNWCKMFGAKKIGVKQYHH